MASLVSPSSRIPLPPPPPTIPLSGRCLIEDTETEVSYSIEINPEFVYSSQATIVFQGGDTKKCQLTLGFPILDKEKLLSKFKKSEEKRQRTFQIKVLPPSNFQSRFIVKISSSVFESDAVQYKQFLSFEDFRKKGSIESIDFASTTCRSKDEEQNRDKKKFLLSILKESKDVTYDTSNAAPYNAVSILSYLNYPICEQDLTGMKLPNAHFVDTLFYMSDLSNANLDGVRMDGVSLNGCRMHHSEMEGVEVGRRPSLDHPEEVSKLSCTKDGRFLATCTVNGTVRIWDLLDYQCLFNFSTEPLADNLPKITNVTFFGNMGPLITAHDDRTLRLWKITSSEGKLELSNKTALFSISVDKFIRSLKGRHFGILCSENNFHLCEALDDNLEKKFTVSGAKDGRNFCLSSNAKLIAFTTANKLTLINASASQELKQEWHISGEISRLEFSFDNRYLIGLIKSNGITIICRWQIGVKDPETIIQEKMPIYDFQLIKNEGQDLCVYSQESMVFGKEIDTKKDRFCLPFFPQKQVQFRTIQARNLLISINDSEGRIGSLDIWEMAKALSSHANGIQNYSSLKEVKPNFKLPKFYHHLQNHGVSLDKLTYLITPNGKYLLFYLLLSKEENETPLFYFCIWSQENDKPRYHFLAGDITHTLKSFILNFIGMTGTNKVTKISSSFQKTFNLSPSDKELPLLAINDHLFMGVAIGKKCTVWDVKKEKALLEQTCNNLITSIFINENTLVICEEGGEISLMDISSKNLISFRGHNGDISGLSFSSDKALLASTSADKTLRVWSLHEKRELYRVRVHARMSNPKFLEDFPSLIESHPFLKTYDNFDGSEYTWIIEEDKLRIYSITPNRFSCTGTDFKDAKGLSDINKRLFTQLGGNNVPAVENGYHNGNGNGHHPSI